MRRQPEASGESGLAAIALVIVIAWALTAVLLLTGTLLSARQIDERVVDVTSQVSAIDDDTDAVELIQETNAVADEILEAADPLSGQLDEIIGAASDIDDSADDIDATVTDINETANEINGTVDDINATVGEITATVGAIEETATEIDDTAGGIADSVTSINERVERINGNLDGVLTAADSIACGAGEPGGSDPAQALATQRERCGDDGVPGIVNRADVVVDLARAISRDTDAIVAEFGLDPDRSNVLGHAESIDENPALESGHLLDDIIGSGLDGGDRDDDEDDGGGGIGDLLGGLG